MCSCRNKNIVKKGITVNASSKKLKSKSELRKQLIERIRKQKQN